MRSDSSFILLGDENNKNRKDLDSEEGTQVDFRY